MSALFGPLSPDEHRIEERLRTLALCVCALGVMGAALAFLRPVLVPFVMANALRYLLAPLVNRLDRMRLGCGVRLPRFVAVLLALSFATALIALLTFIIADSIRQFSANTKAYSDNVEHLISRVFSWMDTNGIGDEIRAEKLKQLGDRLPLTSIILTVIESLFITVTDLALVLIFAVYLLLGMSRSSQDHVADKVEAHITAFIKGKVLLSLVTGLATGALLKVLGVDLWLVFGVLAFWLNFIPNVGALIAVALPLPLVLFNPAFGPATMLSAVLLPLLVHAFVGNVLEPVLFGSSLELHPVVVLLSLMLWSALWGVTGLVLAVPLTAILRIHLAFIDHPLPRLVLRCIDSSSSAAARADLRNEHGPLCDDHDDAEQIQRLADERDLLTPE